MYIVVGTIVALMVIFSVASAAREIRLYSKAARGELQFLVSKRRRNRRLLISFLLLMEAAFLHLGFFVLPADQPLQSLVFWILPMVLIIFIVYLSLQDFRETSRDIDRIFLEAYRAALRKAGESRSQSKTEQRH